LFGSSGGRLNKGEERFLREWVARESNGSKLLFKGHLPDNVKVGRYKDIITVEGFIPSRELGSIFNAIDFLVLPYEKITTSGMYFLALTFQTPIIAPNLHFFNLHSTDGQTSLLYDKNNYSESLNKVLNNAESSWCSNLEEFERLSSIYTWQQSANEISKAFDVLINES
jgi:glycosyltransferase involved in cell wall biosynthesis